MELIIPNPATKSIRNEWRAENSITLPDSRVAKICTTRRYNGQLVSDCTVGQIDTKGCTDGTAFFVWKMGSDFLATLIRADVRVTSRAINAQHSEACAMFETQVLPAINAHYASKPVEQPIG